MTRGPGHRSATQILRGRTIVFVLLVTAVAVAVWVIEPTRDPAGGPAAVKNPKRKPSLVVRYVGDEACARCHADITASFRQHSMGRSLAPVDLAPKVVGDQEGTWNLFEAQGFEYSAQRRDGRTFHLQTRRDRQGRVIAHAEGEVRYVLGSGSRGLSFLVDRGGYLFQSPITWYAQNGRWDLSPGYENRTERFERPINRECLFCHANQVEHVAGTENRYRPPVFRGHAIGCERCHGPGERHVQEPIAPSQTGPTIINPRKLEPALREDVCQQCHLIGKERVAPADHDLFDFRPGLPLYRFLTVFVQPPEQGHEHRNGDQVEQMYQSQCFRASRGALGCISCHDPHRLPAPEEKIAYYRDRCLECHADRPCRVPSSTRLAQSPANNCIGCHMPREPITDISHVSMTIHSIPRHHDTRQDPLSTLGIPPSFDATDLVPFHGDRMSPEERKAVRRDLGVVLGEMRGGAGAAKALPLLEEAVSARSDDLRAREVLANLLGTMRGRESEGSAALEAVLSMAPDRESTLVAAALLASRQQRPEQSIAYMQRAIAINPWRSFYHASLAHQLAKSGRWQEAEEACRNALRINPFNVVSRTILIECHFHKGSPQQARIELDTLLEFDPPNREGLLRWFASLR
jgi:Tfp pilus assembly protein PilF